MRVKCKICDKTIDTKSSSESGIKLNFATDNEDMFNAAMMSKELLALVNHIMTEHPQQAMALYAGLVSKLYSMFEIEENEDPDMSL
ncbi:MAG: hypothetical protein JW727_06405 [Candidatus Aenigmarchaeota archaeon]|nr:hypothetical protein [Candidatus Aenigmarchaeota archaeon]